MTCSICSVKRARRFQNASWVGSTGNSPASCRRAARRKRRSELIPNSAWATHSVMTSASVILRLAFFARMGRRSSAVTNTAVSSRSRSASIVAPLVDGDIEHRRLRPALHNSHHDPQRRGINRLAPNSAQAMWISIGPGASPSSRISAAAAHRAPSRAPIRPIDSDVLHPGPLPSRSDNAKALRLTPGRAALHDIRSSGGGRRRGRLVLT